MEFENSKVHKIRTSCLEWLRLQQRCAFIATEVGSFSADVFGVSETKAIELEIKVSMGDLKRDFRKYKHNYYNGEQYGSNYQLDWHPTHFYFVVPEEMLAEAKEFVAKHPHGLKYGVICAETMAVHKNPKRLHDREPSSKVKFAIALRMGSQLIRFHRDFVV